MVPHDRSDEGLRRPEPRSEASFAARYRALFEDDRDVLYELTPDGVVVALSPSFEALTGWPRGRWVGEKFAGLVHPDDLALAIEMQQRMLAGERPPAHDIRVRTVEGGWRVGEFHTRGIVENGRCVGVLGIGLDVTEARRAERRRQILLRVTGVAVEPLPPPELLERVQQELRDGLGIEIVATFAGPEPGRVRRILSVRAEGAPEEVPVEGQIAVGCERLLRCMESGSTFLSHDPVELNSVRPGLCSELGVRVLACAPLIAARRAHGALVLASGDPASIREDEVEVISAVAPILAGALERAELDAAIRESDRSKTEFVAMLSHELRTPLHIALGYVEMLEEGAMGNLTGGQLEAHGRIRQALETLRELIEQTLSLSRAQVAGVPIENSRVDVRALLREVLDAADERSGMMGVEADFSLDERAAQITADRPKLRSILGNLVENALRFTTEGFVRVEVRAGRGGCVFMVRDTGPGIRRGEEETIFHAFAVGQAAGRSGSTGLGLYIARTLAEAMGGRLAARNHQDGGAIFELFLPAECMAAASATH